MPDISLLPVLANLFSVTTDHLLGVDIDQKERHIQDIVRLSMTTGRKGHHADAAEIVGKGLLDYPGSHRLMYQLLFHLTFVGHIEPDKTKRLHIFKEAADLGEKILAKCTDDSIRHDTIQELCACYAALGEPEKLHRIAATMPGIRQSREFLLAQNTRGKEQLTAKREQACTLLTAAAVMLTQLPSCHETGSTGVSVWEEMTPDDILAAQRNALTILDIL